MDDIFIGTSGYSYKDWEEIFYPAGTKPAGFLNYYSTLFNTVEINSTYYRIPDFSMISKMENKTPGSFIFSLKAHSSFTHTRDAGKESLDLFKEALLPLKNSKKLGVVLLQFPYSFKYSAQNLDYIKNLKAGFGQTELIAEFRNRGWLRDKVFSFLEDSNIGFCNVDEPDLPGLLPKTEIITSKYFYLRFHGRNRDKWWNPDEAYQRYDYMYTEEQLKEWIPKIKDAAQKSKKAFIYFNNHYKAKSVKSAEILKTLLFS